ncbi:2-hydroxyacyl-CoA dehydratase family protein [Kocuria sp. SM24M-10]|uniref:2-hydroxyacyl-CoA dehydratase family protein n=1 Tax=Kocuria sp. SM24M-10 TaxID=1660349 RepID=UPI00064983F3|nr:2-hydroxyacyl-CoA dehydratase family protein [Kocuria sp. SM24M-10]KLU09113.1 2-hydroxyglutaryl-CoA dehydratase [Kocuria sp. SM24M-10]
MTAARLDSARRASAHQKEWFEDLRLRVQTGEPLALVNADAPQEILRAMDIPYVVNQWWASLVGAKRMAERSLDALRRAEYPDDSRQYDAVALGSVDLPAEEAPWGGLPRPGLVIAENSGDAARKVFDLWAESEHTTFFPFERSAAVDAPPRWWELVPHRWEEAFGADRLDLMVAENWELMDFLEDWSGRRFDLDRFGEVMDRVNQQAEWNRRSRDLLATARPMPVSVHDTINSVMLPQWHRGTQWAVDAARTFYEELEAAVAAGRAVWPRERKRLMWIGRGLWFDMDLYRRFEEEYGAVFVWSMYLAIAADGYLRYGSDPMRALAARFTGFTDQLYMPGWAGDWYVKEALTHGVDGVVHLVADDIPGARFTTEALEAAGIPVLEIHASNADPRSSEAASLGSKIEQFLIQRLDA